MSEAYDAADRALRDKVQLLVQVEKQVQDAWEAMMRAGTLDHYPRAVEVAITGAWQEHNYFRAGLERVTLDDGTVITTEEAFDNEDSMAAWDQTDDLVRELPLPWEQCGLADVEEYVLAMVDKPGCSCGMADHGAPGHDGHAEESS